VTNEFPSSPPARPIWLMTLADLALLLVGFFVLIQATSHGDREALARGIRERFGGTVTPAPIPMAAAAMLNFAPASAALPSDSASLAAWARATLSDPRVALTIAGSTDGSPADVDAATGSRTVLAADRARAVAASLAAAGVPSDRFLIVNADAATRGRRQVVVTMGFAGDRRHQ
jgi:hypothetical protein